MCEGCQGKEVSGFCDWVVVILTLCRRTLFKTFPDVLVVQAKRFQLVSWVPTKLGVQVSHIL